MRYCSQCGSEHLQEEVPAGDNRPRVVCGPCGAIHYFNPKNIVGCIPYWPETNSILLCKRAIEPRSGYWTIPAGFLENGETVEEGAARETLEEANARVKISRLQSVFSLPHINQIYIIFLGEMLDLNYSAGDETTDCKLVTPENIPWSELAFTSIDFALKTFLEDLKSANIQAHLGSKSADSKPLH